MKLDGLLLETGSLGEYKDVLGSLANPRQLIPVRLSVVDAAKPYILACLQRDLGRRVLVVTGSRQRAAQLAEQLAAWAGPGALVYGEVDTLFYERASPDSSALRERLAALASLGEGVGHGESPLIVASVRALMSKITAPATFAAHSKRLVVGDTIDIHRLLGDCLASGYRPEIVVDEPGSFARRGGIVDIFSPTSSHPMRLELLGNQIESIRQFDPATQRSTAHIDSVFISPARETLCDPQDLSTRLSGLDLPTLRLEVADRWRMDLEAIEQGDSSWGPSLYEAACCASTLLDYLPSDALVILDEPSELASAFHELDEQAQKLRQEMVDMGELPPDFPRPYASWTDLESGMLDKARLEFDWRDHLDGVADERPAAALGFRVAPSYGGRIKSLVDDVVHTLRAGERIVVISQQARRLLELLEERGVPATIKEGLAEAPPEGSVALVQGDLPEGFKLISAAPGHSLTLLTDREVFGWSKPRHVAPRKAGARNLFVSDLEVGALVVHVEHGVGRFQGLTHLAEGGVDREYIILDYAEGDRLYVPVDQLDRVSKYVGAGEQLPRLHRLGSGDWARTKERVKAAVRDIARDLLEIYAAREIKPGFAFSPDVPWQHELEDAFPFIETPDQLRAIAETKTDMERSKPMDRLICGDVGYGKTEVALRAAFKAVMDGKQVAILVPTTVLAQQHFDTFRERMQAFPVGVEMLSRFRTEKAQEAILAGLKTGGVDICIGTHRLIQKDVQFKDLGLVIIDEEQRFGVAHKERLKQLRKEVDVLTLTATPIPRTLYLALAGIRDISTMETPPEDRLPIKTYVTQNDPRLVREAILRELDRGGQVYYVHNRVQGIGFVAQHLAELVPEALIEVGHGQMPEDRLEKVMVDFAAGKFDVLVCTTIIESGLDIPNVNTIIVNQADRFGLSQLYQLRGRVGRGANRAYAYFLTSKEKRLTPIAEKRLRTIFEATELGSGFKIAARDLELRGAGNLLGTEQHGHVTAVGFDLYCRLLAEAVDELQGKAEEPRPEVTLSLPVTAYLADDYVSDESLRVNMYQRMANVRTLDEVGNLVLEMQDRFGPLPRPALDLVYLLQLKVLAGQAGLRRIETVDDDVVITAGDGVFLRREELQREFGPTLKVGQTQLRFRRQPQNGNWLGLVEQVVEWLAQNPLPVDRAIV
ncbi:MAG: transcription-repair coupling factor [Chloroflexi bacterium]|nr:transcription-repair coupling factor [Chloroflexota bacterium]